MVEIRMPVADSSSSSSSPSSDSESSMEEPQVVESSKVVEFKQEMVAIEPESPKTPPPIFIERKGPAMISCDT